MAAEKYASPSATSGDGSIGDPWNLNIALTNVATLSGGTLYLRGGTYIGNFKSSLNNCTVRSYPNEWAVLSGSKVATLAYDINSTTNKAPLTGSEWFQSAQVIVFTTGEWAQLSSVANGTNWTINRGWSGTTAKAHSAGEQVIIQGPVLAHTGSQTTFRDFEITSLLSTNRTVGTNWWLPEGLDLDVGVSNSAIGLIIHDVGHPGIGYWDQGHSEINGCLIWGVGMNDYSPDYAGGVGTPRGSAIYSQNAQSGMAKIKNCITFRNFTSGGKVYGETGPVLNFGFYSNIVFQVNPTIEGSSGSTSTSNLWFSGNVMMGTPQLSYVSLSNRSTFFINNKVVNGSFVLNETADSFLTNNFVLMPTNAGALTAPFHYHSTHYPTNALNLVWDYNTYYLGNGSSPAQWTFKSLDWPQSAVTNSAGGGILNYQNDSGKAWTNWSLFDAHSSYASNWPSSYLFVQSIPLDHSENRRHIAVICTSGATSATIDLSTNGFHVGDTYTLRDAQHYTNIVSSGTYSGSALTLPLNLTTVSTISGTITNTNFATSHTSNYFNAFVLDRTAGSTIGSLTINGNLIIQ